MIGYFPCVYSRLFVVVKECDDICHLGCNQNKCFEFFALFQYTKALSKSEKLKAFILIAPKMADLVTFLDNNEKSAVYTGEISINSIVI